MTKKILTALLLCISFSAMGQWRVGVNYLFSDYTLHNFQISGQYDFDKRHSLLVGLKYNPNNDTMQPVFRFYYRNYYSDNFWGKLGGILEYKFYLLHKTDPKLYAFYNTQILRKKSKSLDNLNGPGLNKPPIDLPAVNVWENHVGLGIEYNFENIFSLFGSIGGGITHTNFRQIDDNHKSGPIIGGRQWEFSYIGNIGLLVTLSKQTKNATLPKKIKSLK